MGRGYKKVTAFQIAALHGRDEAIRLLKRARAHVNAVADDHSHESALLIALESEFATISTIEALLEGNESVLDLPGGQAALLCAVQRGDRVAMTEYLLEHGAVDTQSPLRRRSLIPEALSFVVEYDVPEMNETLRLLLSKPSLYQDREVVLENALRIAKGRKNKRIIQGELDKIPSIRRAGHQVQNSGQGDRS